MDRPLASVLHLFVLFAAFSASFAFFALWAYPELREGEFEFLYIGAGLFVAGLVLLFGFYALHRGRYLVIKMGVEVEPRIVRAAIEECFARNFEEPITLDDVAVGKKERLQISVAAKQDEELLKKVEKELGVLLRERFGYTKPFYLKVRASK